MIYTTKSGEPVEVLDNEGFGLDEPDDHVEPCVLSSVALPVEGPLAWAAAHPRAGLAESLEEYAARSGVTPTLARPHWRMWGALFLGLAFPDASCPSGPAAPFVIDGPWGADVDGRSERGPSGLYGWPRGEGYPPPRLLAGIELEPDDGGWA